MEGRAYPTEAIVVYYQPRLCIHAAECVRRLPQVFNTQVRPWVHPENAPADQIAEVIAYCPTGALHYERLDGGPPEPVPPLSFEFRPNGPLYMRGKFMVKDAGGKVIREDTRMALCRCGASKNKPFCDNSHLEISFHADAAELEIL